MKYGESAFDIFYLVTAIVIGLLILRKAKNVTEKWMGTAVLILGFGDAFHLVPRVLNYFIGADFTAALGIGKLVTSEPTAMIRRSGWISSAFSGVSSSPKKT